MASFDLPGNQNGRGSWQNPKPNSEILFVLIPRPSFPMEKETCLLEDLDSRFSICVEKIQDSGNLADSRFYGGGSEGFQSFSPRSSARSSLTPFPPFRVHSNFASCPLFRIWPRKFFRGGSRRGKNIPQEQKNRVRPSRWPHFSEFLLRRVSHLGSLIFLAFLSFAPEL